MNLIIPKLSHPPAVLDVARLARRLSDSGFRGDVNADWASRHASSTDNSVYQIIPDAIIAPQDAGDLRCLMEVLDETPFRGVAITARGGGTGTNGQALNRGVVVDFRRHMHHVLALDLDAGWVDVEPGIVLDSLNAELKPHGVFFAPTTSTASRCTIGGMVATDASGKGSRIYGKTSDNVLGLDLMLAGGKCLKSGEAAPEWATSLLNIVAVSADAGRPHLLQQVPALSRRFTGYDLERARPDAETLEWWRLPIGAEGTLGLVTRVRLKLTPLPRIRQLVIVAFNDFRQVLAATEVLLACEPTAIEIIDDWVTTLAEQAGLLASLPSVLIGSADDRPVLAFVEFSGNDTESLAGAITRCRDIAEGLTGYRAIYQPANDAEMAHLWSVRAASVALLGASSNTRRPISFVEDCVVPPQRLVAFVEEFRAILTRHGLKYGMYGHADVGCLHVRPALDIDESADRLRYRQLSDAVYAATKAHGGIFWGEHGKGIRGEYLADFVGPEAYRAFEAIKSAFDPDARFNPGKLVDTGEGLYQIDGVDFRAKRAPEGEPFAHAFDCDGNGTCLSSAVTSPMCPSFKVSGELRHSPKGRAEALRAWRQSGTPDLLAEDIYAALDGCLGCKACAGGCPAKVDIPEMKSRFLHDYHRGRARRLTDRVILALEAYAPLLEKLRPLLQIASAISLDRLIGQLLGLADLPVASRRGLRQLGMPMAQITARCRDRDVLIVPDPYTALYDTDAIASMGEAFALLGYHPMLMPLQVAGKAAHVKGDRDRFLVQARRLVDQLERAAKAEIPLIGTDPAQILMLRHEYVKAGIANIPPMQAFEEFLLREIGSGRLAPPKLPMTERPRVFVHCTEKSLRPKVRTDWALLLAHFGIDAELPETGCCGMSGVFGHEQRHQDWSRKLYEMSWRDPIEGCDTVFATGFSCRCQVERLGTVRALHPAEILAHALRINFGVRPTVRGQIDRHR